MGGHGSNRYLRAIWRPRAPSSRRPEHFELTHRTVLVHLRNRRVLRVAKQGACLAIGELAVDLS